MDKTAGYIRGLIKRIKPSNGVKRPELRHVGWGLTPYNEAVDFYELLVPEGARMAHIPVSTDSSCIVVEHDGRYYYFKLIESPSLYEVSYTIKLAADALECRPLA
jgi:hypothetical protein